MPARRPHRQKDRPRDRSGGFLLTETLAVLAISAIVLIGLASTARFLVRFTYRSVGQAQEADTLGRTMSSLVRDISTLTRARWNGFEPQGFVFRGRANSLYFAHREEAADGTPEDRVVALREINTDAGPRLTRTEARLPAGAMSFDDLRWGPQRLIDTGPARLRFWYISGSKKDTSERQAIWATDAQLPRAIVVEVVDAATTRLLATANIPVHANADIGCIETQGNGGAGQAPPPLDPATGRPIQPNQQAPMPPEAGDLTPPGAGNPAGNPAGAGAGGPPAMAAAFCGRDDKAEPTPQAPQVPVTGPRATL